jgi:hypothetical protein
MKKDVFLIGGAVLLLIIAARSVFQMGILFKIIIGLLILCLFLYRQIKPHSNILYPKHQKWFSCIEYIYDRLFNFIKLNPVKLGNTLSIDVTPLLFLIIFIILLII